MALRLGDGDETKSDLLGGGELTEDEGAGIKGGLFVGLRPARHEQVLLGVAKVKQPDPILGPPETGGGDTGESGGGAGGGGDTGGGDGGDG